MRIIKKGITNTVDWLLHSVLSERQKESLKNVFSEEQQEKLKQLTQFGRKHQQKMAVKQLKDHLYSLGFRNRALEEMISWYRSEKEGYVKRLLAWELTLWYVNQHTEQGAKQALQYIEAVRKGEKDSNQLRRIAVIEAECHLTLQDEVTAKDVLQTALERNEHPDLYLAMANTEETFEKRLSWINQAYTHYGLHPITFSDFNEPTYDDMHMGKITQPTFEEGKVSVILPVYKAEKGLAIAVESILSQTWANLEVLIVDDCSPDNTYEVMKKFAEKDERIKIFQTPQNSGPYVARNIALQAATGEFVTVNDADDWSHEKKIELQVKHLIAEPNIIANTSEHARLTEELYLYRRGTPGKYIFPNMSSTMFRRKPVMEKMGYWHNVRFAADGEFKRRLIKTFGVDSFVDLPTGPLSLPRQAVASLTSSSAFGYNGFFMGVRKEYVESLEYYHSQTANLYYSYPEEVRPFPVPEPMWPEREKKSEGIRSFDIVVATDFREGNRTLSILRQIRKMHKNARIGLVQLYQFDLDKALHVAPEVRDMIDGELIQMLVYGEKVNTNIMYIIGYNIVCEEQTYIPEIMTDNIHLIVTEAIVDVETGHARMEELFHSNVQIIPYDYEIRATLPEAIKAETYFTLREEDWVSQDG